MELDIITQYLLALVPCISALVGIVTTIGIGIGKIKKANKEATSEVKEFHNENVELRRELREIVKENKELKAHLNKIATKMEHMYWVEKED